MNKFYTLTILLLLSFQNTFSQKKEIKGDTTFWHKRNIEFQKAWNLKDFEKTSDEFNFRFRNHEQIVEITKYGSDYSGTIINYIYHKKKANRHKTDTLLKRVVLLSKQAENIYNIVQNSKILDLPSDDSIKNWTQGFDGITYIIEHSDKNTYWTKNYWTPSSQDSIPEAIIVLNLVKKLSDTLKLKEIYSSFEKELPKKGCYNSDGMVNRCYVSNSLELGYSRATKLPFGFYSSYSAVYLGKTKINGGLVLQHNFDNNGFHHLNIRLAKWDIFYKKSTFSDFIVYNYQNRFLRINETMSKFENHQIKYGLNLKKNIDVGAGLDCIVGEFDKIGVHFYGYKGFSKHNTGMVLTTSIFNRQINNKAEILKLFRFNPKYSIRNIIFGLAYESFMNYKDLYFSVRVSL